MSTLTTISGVFIAGIALTAAALGPVYADDSGSVPDAPSAAEALDAVEGIEGILDETVPMSDSPAIVPFDPDDPIVFEGSEVSIGVVTEEDTRTVRRDGVTVYVGTDDDASTVVQPTDDGVRLMTTIASEDSSGEYGYELGIPDGGTVEENEDGSLTVLDGDEIPVAAIEKPWAQDANGDQLDTTYTMDGNVLTQHVNLDGAAFPVVADPLFIPVALLVAKALAAARVLALVCIRHSSCHRTVILGAGNLTAQHVASAAAWGNKRVRCVSVRMGWKERVSCFVFGK